MKSSLVTGFFIAALIWLQLFPIAACKKDSADNDTIDTTDTTVIVPTDTTCNPGIADEYDQIAGSEYSGLWGPYNLHDPSIIKDQGTYYIYSTDVSYGSNGQCGIMWRKSSDLVNWKFKGWVFNGIPSIPLQFMQYNQPGYQAEGLWAPYIIKIGDQFRLYYSVPGNDYLHLACIALATSSYPDGPWIDQGIVISCLPSDTYNAIDPSVTVDPITGKQWMTYGSYDDGIFIVELNPETGKRLNQSDLGKLIAKRTNRHDAIEGSEILYNTEQQMYYLFVSYDWLEDNYNVRVGRSVNPDGPYYDFNGNDMAAPGDNIPMITAQYKFNNHSGWQGFGHCGLLHDGDNYYYVSQARLGSNKYFMDLHIHRMIWTSSGWPSISPQRYVNVPQPTISASDIIGKWELIELKLTASKNTSTTLEFKVDGSITGITGSTWSYDNSWLTISLNNGESVYTMKVLSEWDWENKCLTKVFTGLSQSGVSAWGKKVN
jgi:arabinan endo-1,5-alpha-L-arabinosidase